MNKRFWQVSAIVSSGLAVAVAGVGIAASNRLMYVKKKDESLILDRENSAKRYDEVWYAKAKKSELCIESENDYPIKPILLETHNTNRSVIICHGVTETEVNSFKYA